MKTISLAKIIDCFRQRNNPAEISDQNQIADAAQIELKNSILTTQQEASPDAILLVDDNAEIISYNQQFIKLWGIPAELVKSGLDKPVLGLVMTQMADPESFLNRVKFLYEHKGEKSHEELLLADGRVVDRYSAPVVGGNGKYHGRVWYFRDITERKNAESQQRLAVTIFNASSQAMIITDYSNVILKVNPAFTQITGYAADEVIGKNPGLLKSGLHDKDFFRNMWHSIKEKGYWEGEIWNRRKNGELFAEWLTINAIREPGDTKGNYVALFSDITEKKKSDELVWEYANYDALTHLPNRRLFHDRLEQEIKKSRRSGSRLVLFFIDLDHFKEVNDTFGHMAGDNLLVEAAQRIIACVRESDTVARLGGDEFTVILSDIGDAGYVERIARGIIKLLSQDFQFENGKATISASIGIAVYPVDADDSNQLVANADKAMYQSKNKGRNCFSYFAEIQ